MKTEKKIQTTIKLVSIKEIEEVMEIYKKAKIYMSENDIDQWDEIYPSKQDLFQDINKNELHGIYINDQLNGMVALNTFQDPEYIKIKWRISDRSPIVVHRLCINPENNNKGLAFKLMSYTETWAINNGYSSIRLDAFTKNLKAVRLYERLNYQNVGIVQLRKGTFYCFEKSFLKSN